ncbi:cation:proton antiporter [Mucilaginibacter dorajii]|uniref:Cation/H+ exchanger transmembrane domain-containing protein n=1 Tax=Mucilaginibacter dorajii TaxID=692994 RepID=A0ABP7P6Z7_9SPHI|nr:cation:proton antiporter [Mucilaginibacter dorajii]MCS3736532.1 Kef-type K+ transport system membrane component KefB [Mucilaginibacter dorajii]
MKQFRNIFFYVILLGVFSFLIYYVLMAGDSLEQGRHIVKLAASSKSPFHQFMDGFIKNLTGPLATLLAQIAVIIIAGNMAGWVCKKLGQPRVIGEIFAGIALGPSLVGRFLPAFSHTIFPVASLGSLQFLSQIGLIIFMFVIGMELDLRAIKNKSKDAIVISHASIVVPFTLGLGLAYYIYRSLAPAGIPFFSFGLFMGISMSITAFPVLARICQERGINKTRLGALVITCAAADDITAWCLLTIVIAVVKAGSVMSFVYTVLMAVTYVILMLKAVKPLLKKVYTHHIKPGYLGIPVSLFFLTLIISAYATEAIGIHALFGAFMAGIVMPDNITFRSVFIERIKDVALFLLLPLFFVFTGLRTQIGLLNNIYLWGTCGLVILVAITGKFVGSASAAKFIGQSWKNSLSIGALMNTRGLVELIVLNIGYDLGVLNKEVFAMLVIMALVTTIMTVPILNLLDKAFGKTPEEENISEEEEPAIAGDR